MTRTARAAYPRAVLRDRSESRSGLDPSIRKDGAGQHNWGSLADERQLEFDAIEDEMREAEDDNLNALKPGNPKATANEKSDKANMSEEELEKARQYRKNTFKKQGEIDLVDIARTSAGASPVTHRPSQDNKMTHASDATSPL